MGSPILSPKLLHALSVHPHKPDSPPPFSDKFIFSLEKEGSMVLKMIDTPVFAIAIAAAGVPQKQSRRVVALEQKLRDAQLDFEKGIRYADGAGLAKDMQKAAGHHRKAAETDHMPAQYNLADLLDSRAPALSRQAAESGYPGARE